MVINYLNILGALRSPHKANSPLIVDADAVLPLPTSLQSFESIAWWNAQIIKNLRPVKLFQLSKRRTLDIDPEAYASALEKGLGVLALETLYCHGLIVTHCVNNVNRCYIPADSALASQNGRFMRSNVEIQRLAQPSDGMTR